MNSVATGVGRHKSALFTWTASALVFALFLLFTAYHNLQIFQKSRFSALPVPQGPFILRAGTGTPSQINCSARLAPYSYTIDTGPELFSVIQEDPNVFDVLFARLQGPGGRHFACFLMKRGPLGEYACPDAVHLPAGSWNVSVIVYRRQCVHLNNDIGLLQHILDETNHFSQFDKFLEDVVYPPIDYKKGLRFVWEKGNPHNLDLDNEAKGDKFPKNLDVCLSDSPGVWQQLPSMSDGMCQPPLCPPQLDTDLLNKPYNKERKIQHFFQPFACSYHFYTKEEARNCIALRRPVFAGDSRIRELYRHIQFWLGNPPGMTLVPLEVPLHFGMNYFFASELHETVQKEALQGRSIIINSLLHDLAELGRFGERYTNVGNVRKYLGHDACPTDCQPDDSAVKCKCTKIYAPHRYVANIQRLKALFETIGREEEGRRADSAARTPHFWVSINRKFPDDVFADRIFSWQTNDVLMELEDYAHSTLASVGVGHVDFRPHLMSAPIDWWKDMVHYGSHNTSFLQHMSFQVLLNRLCPFNVVGEAAAAAAAGP